MFSQLTHWKRPDIMLPSMADTLNVRKQVTGMKYSPKKKSGSDILMSASLRTRPKKNESVVGRCVGVGAFHDDSPEWTDGKMESVTKKTKKTLKHCGKQRLKTYQYGMRLLPAAACTARFSSSARLLFSSLYR